MNIEKWYIVDRLSFIVASGHIVADKSAGYPFRREMPKVAPSILCDRVFL